MIIGSGPYDIRMNAIDLNVIVVTCFDRFRTEIFSESTYFDYFGLDCIMQVLYAISLFVMELKIYFMQHIC